VVRLLSREVPHGLSLSAKKHDKFHVAQHLSQAVDEVRRQENKALLAEGDEQLKAPSTSGCVTRLT
jgi:hypothetical protein